MTPIEHITLMAEQIVRDHPVARTMIGTPMRSSQFPLEGIEITLPPQDMLALARDPSLIPREMVGLPVWISEAPSRLNKPSGHYMLSVNGRYTDDKGLPRRSVGRVTLSEHRENIPTTAPDPASRV